MVKVTETTSTVLNKILIPVITTVLGATAIYFLGFNNKKGSGRSEMEAMLLTKEQTVKAWKSYVASQNIAHKNVASISEEYSQRISTAINQGDKEWLAAVEDLEDEMFREAEKTQKDIENILKDEDQIDKNFVSMLYRALDNHKDQMKKAKVLFQRLKDVITSDASATVKQQRWMEEAQKFTTMGDKIDERSATEAEAISKILSERYAQAFDLNELLVYVEYKNKTSGVTSGKDGEVLVPPADPGASGEGAEENDPPPTEEEKPEPANEKGPSLTVKYLTGHWQMKGGTLELDESGSMYWAFDGKGYTSGTWTIRGIMVHMNAINPDTKKKSLIICSISNRKPNSFTLSTMSNPVEVYEFVRKK